MQKDIVTNDLKQHRKEECSPQEILYSLLKEIECESVSMFLVKDEKEFLSVLRYREEDFCV